MNLKMLSSYSHQILLPSLFLLPILIACTSVRPQVKEPEIKPQPSNVSTRSTTETRGQVAEKPKCTANICVDGKPGTADEITFFKQNASLLAGKASDLYADDVDGFQDLWTYHRFKISEAGLQELAGKLGLELDDSESCKKVPCALTLKHGGDQTKLLISCATTQEKLNMGEVTLLI